MTSGDESMRYQVDLLPVAHSEIPGPELFWMGGWGEWFELCFQAVLIRGPGVVALVNTGPAEDLAPLNDAVTGVLGERARIRREPSEFIVDQLAEHDVSPEQVTHVVLTPFQLYTVSNVMRFPNAEIAVSKRGWLHFHVTKRHPHDSRESSLPDPILIHLVTDAWERVRLLEDEDELAPGLRTWWAGSHHRATLCVEVDTELGVVAITDALFVMANLERDHPIGICENLQEALAAHQRLRASASIVLPLYDPGNFERFPGGRVTTGA